MSVVVAIDAGTTGVRALAVDGHGHPVGMAYREFPQHFPRPGWVEHDPLQIWSAVRHVLAELADELEHRRETIAAVGITNQRETALAWDRRTGEPRTRAIVWQDRRTAHRCDELRADGHLPLVRRRTGLVLDPYFSGTKWAWMLQEGGVAADADLALGTVDSWLVWKLTGGRVHATDPSNASRTMCFDIHRFTWDPELCELLGVPIGALPAVVPSSGELGITAGDCGLPARIPIAGIAGDQQAALFGQACFEPGMTKNTYGTGSFVLMQVGHLCPAPTEGLLTTVAWQLADGAVAYALEGAIFVTGAAIQWLRDGLGIIREASEIGPLAASVPDTAGVTFVPAFAGLGSPWWDPYARGTILGLTRGAGRATLARAVVEAIAFEVRDAVDAMTGGSGHPVLELRADGGAAVMDLLLQLQADQLGVAVARPAVSETTALGAAWLAGLGARVWGSLEELSSTWALDRRFEPSCGKGAADLRHAQWTEAVRRSRAWESDG